MIRWEDPPVVMQSNYVWKHAAVELSANPGRWALMLEDADPDYALGSVRNALVRHGCEVRTQSRARRTSVWARWPEEA